MVAHGCYVRHGNGETHANDGCRPFVVDDGLEEAEDQVEVAPYSISVLSGSILTTFHHFSLLTRFDPISRLQLLPTMAYSLFEEEAFQPQGPAEVPEIPEQRVEPLFPDLLLFALPEEEFHRQVE